MLIASFVLFVLFSCTTENSKIKQTKLEKAIEKFDKDDVDSIKTAYLKYLRSDEGIPAREMVFHEEFTYKNIFDQIDSLSVLNNKYQDQFQLIFNRIDNFCVEHQKKIEDFLELQKTLNQAANVRIIALRKTKWDKYYDVIEIKIRVKNKQKNTIQHIKYQLRIVSNNETIFLPLKLDLPVTSTYDYSYIYDNNAHASVYNELEKAIVSGYTYSCQVTELVVNGQKISLLEHEASEFFKDNALFAHSPKVGSPSDYCPYLDENDPLVMEVRELIDEKNNEIKQLYPHLFNFWLKIN